MSSIDVAVPCYQYGRYLRDCVTSITSQDLENLRVLIIDNGSTDDTLKVANALAQEDERVTVLHHPRNLGQKHAYNAAIAWASATYFMILDADDALSEGALSRAVSVMESDPSIAFSYGEELQLPFAAGEVPPSSTYDTSSPWVIETSREFLQRLCRMPINIGVSTLVTRTSVQKTVGIYNPALVHADDVEMWLRLACHGKVAGTRTVQAIRRLHGKQISKYFDSSFVHDCEERYDAYAAFFSGAGSTLDDSAALFRCAKRSIASRAYWSGVSHLVRGHLAVSLDLFKFTFRHHPSMAILPPLDWLSRMESPWQRIASVLAAMNEVRRGTVQKPLR